MADLYVLETWSADKGWCVGYLIKCFFKFHFIFPIKVFGYVFGIRFVLKITIYEIINKVAKYVTLWNEGTFVRTAPVQDVGVLLKWNNLKSFGKGLTYVCSLLLLTIKFYLQNQSPKCRVDGY